MEICFDFLRLVRYFIDSLIRNAQMTISTVENKALNDALIENIKDVTAYVPLYRKAGAEKALYTTLYQNIQQAFSVASQMEKMGGEISPVLKQMVQAANDLDDAEEGLQKFADIVGRINTDTGMI